MILSEEPYLILHKVRGEPAFDIAIKMDAEDGDEPWWVIPTSGHRAYPCWYEELSEVVQGNRQDIARNGFPAIPDDWPDHYQTCAAPGKGKWTGSALLEKLGLRKPQPKFARRF